MRYRLLDAGGNVLDEGEGEVAVKDGGLFVPAADLRVAATAIAEVAETDRPYGLRVVLTEGATLELTMLGRMRGQIFADLNDGRAKGLIDGRGLGGIGTPEIFPGAADQAQGEIYLYDDCLLAIPGSGAPARVLYSFVDGVAVNGYQVTVNVTWRPPMVASELGRRTTEFAGLLDRRCTEARDRLSAFLGALLPDLGPIAARSLARTLRDGLAASPAQFDAIGPAVRRDLIEAVIHARCRAGLIALEAAGPVWIGFKQVRSVRRAAEGVTAWHDSAHTPNIHGHGNYGGYGGYYGGYGWYGGGGPDYHAMTPRADVRPGSLIPAHDDHSALTAVGADPTVLAFALCQIGPGRIVYQPLNMPDRAPKEYQAPDIPSLAPALVFP